MVMSGRRAAGVVGMAAAMMAAGCAHTVETPLPIQASPVVRGADCGLELRWWVLPDDGDVIARALASYEARPGPVDAAARDLWRGNGFRIVAVPVDELGGVQARLQQLRAQVIVSDLRAAGVREQDLAAVVASMASAPATQEQWLGEVPRWTDAVRGPAMGRGTGRPSVVMMDSGPLALGPGRLRLLLRSWAVPTQIAGDRAAAGLHLELAPQFEEARPSIPDWGIEEADMGLVKPLALEDQGLVLSRLVLSLTLDGSEALVIVPERPETEWGTIASGEPVAPVADRGIFGPAAPRGVTLGEAMLSAEPGLARAAGGAIEGSGLPRRPAKAMIVLVPRVPERFELLGR
jgi:hypothetical protein